MKVKYSSVIPCATARDGGSAENAGAVFCQPGMVEVQKTQEQFSANADPESSVFNSLLDTGSSPV